jgi:DNA-binding transcriptional ArsR family regulator
MGDQALLSILQHPLRRELLKLYVEGGEMRSPKELTLPTNRPISNVGYHVRVLAEKGAIELITVEPRRGSIEHFYKATSLVDEVPWGRAALGLPPLNEGEETSAKAQDGAAGPGSNHPSSKEESA